MPTRHSKVVSLEEVLTLGLGTVDDRRERLT